MNTNISNYDHASATKLVLKNLFPHDFWILPLCFALTLSPYIVLPVSKKFFDTDDVGFMLPLFLVGIILLFCRSWRRRNVIWSEKRNAAFRRGQTKIYLNPTEMHVVSTGYEYRIKWTHVFDVINGKDGLLVLVSGCEYYPIPLACLPEEMRQADLKVQIRAWIGSNTDASPT